MSKEEIVNAKKDNIPNTQKKNSIVNNNYEENDVDDEENFDNLKYINLPKTSINSISAKRSSVESMSNKFSIDMPNVSKQRIHTYLNNDLITALEASPNVPLNQKTTIGSKLSLVGETSEANEKDNNDVSQNNRTINININMNTTQKNIINNIVPMTNVEKDEEIYSQFYPNNAGNNNNFQNISNMNNISNNIQNVNIPNINMVNMPNMQGMSILPHLTGNNGNIPICYQPNYPYMQQYGQNMNKNQKIKKVKKPFEIREGDWTCFKCSNLNFSFRNKCNRCGLTKAESISEFEKVELNRNQMSIINNLGITNFGVLNGVVNNVNNISNPNILKQNINGNSSNIDNQMNSQYY